MRSSLQSLLAGCRAVKRGSGLGALNAGQAWILGCEVVDGFWAKSFFKSSGVYASRALLFLSASSDLRSNVGIGLKVPFNFYNLINIAPAGALGRGGGEGDAANDSFSLCLFLKQK